jgi:CRISPR/Cas system endoribonuclease Cas6 (RAMP superfamily)
MKFSDREHFHPYIIRDIREIKRHSSEIQVEFTLFGFITQHMDKVIPSIIEMSRFPIIFEGRKISFYTERIVDQSGKLVFDQKKHIICHPTIFSMELTPEISNRVKMRFDTPLRIKHNNIFMRSFLFDPIILSLYRRLVYLNEHFNNSELKLSQYEINDQIVISSSQFKWEERPRKSLVKDQVMSLGGLLGEVELSNVDPYTYQLLKLGEIVQVGKQTSFGLGKYTMEDLN